MYLSERYAFVYEATITLFHIIPQILAYLNKNVSHEAKCEELTIGLSRKYCICNNNMHLFACYTLYHNEGHKTVSFFIHTHKLFISITDITLR